MLTNYHIHEGEMETEAIEPVLLELRERWNDSARLLGFLVETLRTQQQRIASLKHHLGRVQSIIASTRRLQAGETLGGILGLLYEEDKKLAAGEDPLEIIAWVLIDEARSGWFGGGDGTQMDPLDEYRL